MSGPNRSAPPSAESNVAVASDSHANVDAINARLANGFNAVLPANKTIQISAPIRVPSFASLAAVWWSTIIQAAPDFTGEALIILDAAATEQIAVRNLRIDGNKAGLTSGATPHGILLFNSGALFPFSMTDAHDRLIDILVANCKGDGVRLDAPTSGDAQAREAKLRGVTAYRNDGHGIYVRTASDVKLSGVVGGNNGLNGIELDSAGNAQLTDIKGFGSGQIDAVGAGYGLRVKAGQVVAANVSVQDNKNDGAKLEAIDFNCVGLTADSNGQTTALKSGVRVSFGKCSIVGFSALDRWSGGAKVQAYPVTIDATDFQASVIDNVTIIGNSRNHATSDAPQNLSSGRNIVLLINGQSKQMAGPLVVAPKDDASQAYVARRNSATQAADLILVQDEGFGTLLKVDKDGVVTSSRTGNGAPAFRASVRGDAQSRMQIGNDGAYLIGDGASSPTVRLSKDGLAGQIPRIVMPLGVGGNPLVATLSAKGVPTTNGARIARVYCPTSGGLADLWVFVTTTGGNTDFGLFDTGDASAGNRTKLYSTGSIPTPAVGKAIVAAGSLAANVVAGQQLDAMWAADSFTPQIAHHNIGSTFASMTTLPSGFNAVPGGASPKLAATAATVFPLPATIAEASVLATNADCLPLIFARIT